MAKYSQTMNFNIKTNYDNSGLSKLQGQLSGIINQLHEMQSMKLINNTDVAKSIDQISKLKTALNQSFNSSLGMLDSRKFVENMKASGLTVNELEKSFSRAGTAGTVAFNDMIGRISKVDKGLISVSKTTDKIANTIGNTFRWGVVSSGFSGMLNAVHQSVQYIKDLDESLTNIQMLTGQSKQDMYEFANQANQAAKSLGSTTVDMTNASLIFAQQGFGNDKALQLGEVATKVANISQQDTATAADQITAYMNAYNFTGDLEKINAAMDSWANLANVSASSVEELAVASQKSASTASTVGVNMDQLGAQIATIESVTREAPETIGNGLKTIYSRFADLKAGKTLDDDVSLGKVTGQLEDIGIAVLDSGGKMRDVGDIMEDLMAKWKELDQTQKSSIAGTLAGTYQLSRFNALMNRSDLYSQYKYASSNAAGTADQMNENYLNSLGGQLKTLQATFEGVINKFVNGESFSPLLEWLTQSIDLFGKLIDSIGGAGNALTLLGALATKAFSHSVAAGASNLIKNLSVAKQRRDNAAYSSQVLQSLGVQNVSDDRSKNLLNFAMQTDQENLTEQEINRKNSLINNHVPILNNAINTQENFKNRIEATNIAYRVGLGQDKDIITKTRDGKYDFSQLKQGFNFDPEAFKIQIEDLLKDRSFNNLQNAALKGANTASQTTDFLKNNSAQDVFKNTKYLDMLNDSSSSFISLTGNSVLSKNMIKNVNKDFNDLLATLDELERKSKNGVISEKEWNNAIQKAEKYEQTLRNINRVTQGAANGEFFTSNKEIDSARQKIEDTTAALNESDQKLVAFQKDLARTNHIETLVNTASAIGGIAFAIQSVKSLGSIWTDEDISLSDKILSTVVDLSLVLPTIIVSIKEIIALRRQLLAMDTGSGLLDFLSGEAGSGEAGSGEAGSGKAGSGGKKRKQKKGKVSTTDSSASAARSVASAAETTSKGFVDTFKNIFAKDGLKAVGGTVAKGAAKIGAKFIPVIGGALTAVDLIQSAYNGITNMSIEEDKKQFDETNQKNQTNIEKVDNFQSLYDQYQQTGEKSEDLKAAALDVADSLGDESLKVKALAEDYQGLAAAMQTAKDNQYQGNVDASKQVTDGALKGEMDSYTPVLDMFGGVTGQQGSLVDAYKKATGGGSPIDLRAISVSYDGTQGIRGTFSGNEEQKDYIESLIGPFSQLKNLSIDEAIGKTQDFINDLTLEKQKLDEKGDNLSEDEKQHREWIESSIEAFSSSLQSDNTQQWMNARTEQANNASNISTFQQSVNDAGTDIDKMKEVFSQGDMAEPFANVGEDAAQQYRFMAEHITDETLKQFYALKASEEDAVKNMQIKGVSEEDARTVIDTIEKQLGNGQDAIELVGSLDPNTTTENIQQQINEYLQNKFKVTLKADFNTEEIKKAAEEKGSLKDLIDQYNQTLKSGQGGFSEDEAANLIANNEDYAKYLIKVGDQYRLNQKALDDWNVSRQRQTDAMNKAMDSSYRQGLSEEQTRIEQENKMYSREGVSSTVQLDNGMEFNTEEVARGIYNVNQALSDTGNLQNWTDGISELAKKMGELGDVSDPDKIGLSSDELVKVGQNYRSIASSIGDVVSTATKQFQRGGISLGQYSGSLGQTAKASASVMASQKGLVRQGEKWVAVAKDSADITDENADGLDDFDQQAADTANALEENGQALQDLSGTMDYIGEHADDLSSWFGEYGTELDTDAIEQSGERYNEVMKGLSDSLADYYIKNQDKLHAFIEEQKSLGTITEEQANNIYASVSQGAEQLSNTLFQTSDEAYAFGQAMAKDAMENNASMVGAVSQGITQMLAGMQQLLSQFSIKINAQPTQGEPVVIPTTGIVHNVLEEKTGSGDVTLPSFSYDINTEGSSLGISSDGTPSEEVQKGIDDLSKGIIAVNSSFSSGSSGPGFAGAHAYAPASSEGVGNIDTRSPGEKKNNSDGGGGGGDGDDGAESKYEAKTKEHIEDEIDRYERVDTLLNAIEKDYDGIAKSQDRLVGVKLAENIAQQIKLLERQIELQKQKLELQKQEAEEYKNRLASEYGVTFDAEGFISNYAQIHQALIDEVNGLIDQYNNTFTEEGQNALEDQIEAAQKRLDKFVDLYGKFDDLTSSIRETQNAIEDLNDSIEDLRIDAFNKMIDSITEVGDINSTWRDIEAAMDPRKSDDPFLAMENNIDRLGDHLNAFSDESVALFVENMRRIAKEARDAGDAVTADFYDQLANNAGKDNKRIIDYLMDGLSTVHDQLRQIRETGTSSIFGENTAALYESMQNIYELAAEELQSIKDLQEEILQNFLDAVDKMEEQAQELADRYSAITDEFEHQLNIVQMIQGEKAYDQMNLVLDARINANKDQINMWTQYIDEMKRQQAIWEEGSDQWKAYEEKIVSAQSTLNDLVESSLEDIQEKYNNTVNKLVDDWAKKAFGTDDLDWMSTEWELINRNADQYLDSVNKAYNIQKLQNKYQQMLNDSNDLHVQQEITKQMATQLDYLRNKTKLSQYDVDYANAQLEILQKQIALEEARNNKNQMRLKRDTQGNYNYVYTANEDDIATAEDELLDAQNNAYNLSKNNIVTQQENALSAAQQAKSQIIDIWTTVGLSLEEKQKRMTMVMDNLKTYLEGTNEQLAESNKNILNDFSNFVGSLTDQNAGSLQNILKDLENQQYDTFNGIDSRFSASITEWIKNLDDFNLASKDLIQDLTTETGKYQTAVDDMAKQVKQNFNDVSDVIQRSSNKTNDLNTATSNLMATMREEAGVIEKNRAEFQKYADQITDLKNKMSDIANELNNTRIELQAQRQENMHLNDIINGTASGGSGSGGGGNGAGNLSDGIQVGDVVGFHGWYYNDSEGQDPAGNQLVDQPGAVVVDDFSSTEYGGRGITYGDFTVHISPVGGGNFGWVRPDQLFDTGGYTGTWSDGDSNAKNGKLAYLHQKELVLNATDTENILAAVNSVRDMATALRSGVAQSFADCLKSLPNITSSQDREINQNVTIDATFPGVQTAIEIQDALNSLVSRASQYAFKTK